MKVLVHSANLGGIDKMLPHAPQSIPYDWHISNDTNFAPRSKAMTPRLQARIPKTHGWQMFPGYDFYMWIDGNLQLKAHDSLFHFLEPLLDGYDVVALRHHRRPNIRQEVRYIRKGLREQSRYLVERYAGELLKEEYSVIQDDPSYTDDCLLLSGAFMYRDTAAVRQALKEWWYHISRYHIVDQIGFVYALRKAGLKIKVLDDIYNDCWYLGVSRHGRGA
jgi:hypothetical protein